MSRQICNCAFLSQSRSSVNFILDLQYCLNYIILIHSTNTNLLPIVLDYLYYYQINKQQWVVIEKKEEKE